MTTSYHDNPDGSVAGYRNLPSLKPPFVIFRPSQSGGVSVLRPTTQGAQLVASWPTMDEAKRFAETSL